MFSLRKPKSTVDASALLSSALHDETTFYQAFIEDLMRCKKELIIESPYITTSRMKHLWPVFSRLHSRGVKITIITKDFDDLDENLKKQSEIVIKKCERVGIQVLLCIDNHHRKLAILDRKILWEGSLNVLSQTHSREIMRRIESEQLTLQMFDFLKLGKFL